MTLTLRHTLVAAVTAVALAGCASDDTDSNGTAADPAQALADAKQALLDTSGVSLELSTPSLPDGVDGLVKAEGVLTPAPAFDGNITVRFSGFDGEVEVRSLDNKVYAVLPFRSSFSEIDPGEYGAPDPASLIDGETGIPSWLSEVTEPTAGDRVRDGQDILQTYRGTLAADVVNQTIPSAGEGSFDTVFIVDDEGRLRTAEVTGEFYSGKPELTYTVEFSDYDADVTIEAP